MNALDSSNHEKPAAQSELETAGVTNPFDTDSLNDSAVTRREFLTISAALSAVGLAGCALAGCALAGCASNLGDESSTRTPAAVPANGEVRGAAPVMARVITPKMFAVAGGGKLHDGEAIVFTVPEGAPGVVLRLNGKLRAMSAKCTHVGCTVLWDKTKSQLRCPCHNSHFDTNGKVLNGPAKTPLPQWTVSAQGDDAIVTI